jgi:hypothetical protein
MHWIDLAQDRDQWRFPVNMVMNLQVPYMLGSSRVAAQLVASREGLSSMELFLVNNMGQQLHSNL